MFRASMTCGDQTKGVTVLQSFVYHPAMLRRLNDYGMLVVLWYWCKITGAANPAAAISARRPAA